MRPISQTRFNALGGYCRRPQALFFAEELNWFEYGDERILAVLIRDRTDNDFGGLVLGRDRKGRFRCIDTTEFYESKYHVETLLGQEMERLSAAPDEDFYQGDEAGEPVDFFAPIASNSRLNENFMKLSEEEGFSPARGIIEPMMHWYEDLDGNFIEQFQTTGFDARLWELYLFAVFVELGYHIERVHAVPDFVCAGILGNFAVEAMTANPTKDRDNKIISSPWGDTQLGQFYTSLREYMPIKFGSTLTSKVAKKYWEKPAAKNKPLIFAIQDFSDESSMTFTHSALPVYLYGYDWEYDNHGQSTVTPRQVRQHRWGNKVIESGFFDLPGVENVSAVMSNNGGTISKFNRMGVLAGFGSRRVVLTHFGFAMNHDRNSAAPHVFTRAVNDPDYGETWVEGLNVFHNPHAARPINPEMLPGAAHHWLLGDGQMESLIPDFHPLSSITFTAYP